MTSTSPSLLARCAAGVALLLAIVLGQNVIGAGTPTGALLAGAAWLAVVGSAVVLAVRPGFEAGLLLGITAVATALGALLTVTVGMPGSNGPVVGATQVLLLVLSVAVALLLLAALRVPRTRR